MAKYTHDIVATTGEYTNKAGEKKKNYTNVGKAFTDDQGRISMKLTSIPVGPEWSGWLSLYPAKDKEQGGNREPQGARSPEYGQRETHQNGAPPPRDNGAVDNMDDDIPFGLPRFI